MPEVAKKMISKGYDNDAISEFTELSVEQIEKIRSEISK